MSRVKGDCRDLTACRARNVSILIPIFNDWESLAVLLPQLDTSVGSAAMRGHVFVIDDASTVRVPHHLRSQRYNALSCEIVHLRCNLGHQRAIAVGIAGVQRISAEFDAIVIMDGDGEDRPADLPLLVAELMTHTAPHIVFAARSKRLEAPAFRFMYHLFRIVHRVLTGISVRVGNFSALYPSAAARILSNPDLWNHYAAAVFRSRIPFSTIGLERGKRYRGRSHMDYSNLVAHGLSAIAVFSDTVGARLLMGTAALIALFLTLLLVCVLIRIYTSLAIPAWAGMAVVLSLVLLTQAFLSLLVWMFIVLGNRSRNSCLTPPDADAYVDSVESLC